MRKGFKDADFHRDYKKLAGADPLPPRESGGFIRRRAVGREAVQQHTLR
jgi:hypothetical protein